MPQEVEDAITQAAQEPRSAFADGVGATGQDIGDLIEADRYLESKKAMAKRSGLGIKMNIMIPPGSA